MNCLEFRKVMLTEPRNQSEALRTHAQECPGCAQFEQASLRFERLLGEALELPVPPNLEERILLQHHAERAAPRAPVDRRRFLAMAACVGAAAVGTLAFIGLRQRESVIEAIVLHAREVHGPGLVSTAGSTQAAQAAVRSLMNSTGLSPGPLEGLQIADAWPCATLGVRGTHLRLVAPSGIVEASHCPGEAIGRSRITEHDGFIVELHPHPSGMLSLVATDPSALDELRAATLAAFGIEGEA
jgi:hypothetical protein